mmetsp:Transcript_24303/g.43130  ORF Transcript_24303/g.43130 Transcript_24303/m.43130 type:complete len:249 (-) Transcript_24303:183-929(-)
MIITAAASKLVFTYLNLPLGLGGRGGVQRFFLLSQDIPFSEQLFPVGDAWATEKERLKTSGENPSGTVPIVVATRTMGNNHGDDHHDDRQVLPQHIATARYLASVFDRNSGDAYKDYVQDLVADEYQGFRDKWVAVSFSGTDEEKAKYRQDELPKQLVKFDALYQQFKTHDTFLSVSPKTKNPLWGDAAVFGLLRDHILTGHLTLDELKAYDHLSTMYQAYEKIPAIANWIDNKEKELAAQSAATNAN